MKVKIQTAGIAALPPCLAILPYRAASPARVAAAHFVVARLRAWGLFVAIVEHAAVSTERSTPIQADAWIHLADGGPFNRARCLNAGVYQLYDQGQGREEGIPLLFHDADIMCEWLGLFGAILTVMKGSAFAASPYDRLAGLTREQTGGVLERLGPDAALDLYLNDHYARPALRPHYAELAQPGAAGGALVMDRGALEGVGGWDEEFSGWGCEDDAMNHALQGRIALMNSTACHLWHDTDDRDPALVEANKIRFASIVKGGWP